MICSLCRGSGSMFSKQPRADFEWWTCQACGGSGVRIQYGPATIKIHAFREKWAKKRPTQEDKHE